MRSLVAHTFANDLTVVCTSVHQFAFPGSRSLPHDSGDHPEHPVGAFGVAEYVAVEGRRLCYIGSMVLFPRTIGPVSPNGEEAPPKGRLDRVLGMYLRRPCPRKIRLDRQLLVLDELRRPAKDVGEIEQTRRQQEVRSTLNDVPHLRVEGPR